MTTLAAVDLGAQSGRVAVGRFDGERLAVDRGAPVRERAREAGGTLHWDVLGLLPRRARRAARGGRAGRRSTRSRVDSWAVDFGLVDRGGRLLRQPRPLPRRAARRGVRARARADPGAGALRAHGHPAPADQHDLRARRDGRRAATRRSRRADRLLLIPDLFHSLALRQRGRRSGRTRRTTQCFDPRTRRLGGRPPRAARHPDRLLPEVVAPGTPLGALAADVADETRPRRRPTSWPSRRTTPASAVAAVPFRATAARSFVSVGTWSLVGVEVRRAGDHRRHLRREPDERGRRRRHRSASSATSRASGCCTSAGARGRTQGRDYAFDELVALATAAPPLALVRRPERRRRSPSPATCRRGSARSAPRRARRRRPTPGAIVRCILESLALKHAETVELLARGDRAGADRAPRRRRRRAQRAALPLDGRAPRPAGARRAGGGDAWSATCSCRRWRSARSASLAEAREVVRALVRARASTSRTETPSGRRRASASPRSSRRPSAGGVAHERGRRRPARHSGARTTAGTRTRRAGLDALDGARLPLEPARRRPRAREPRRRQHVGEGDASSTTPAARRACSGSRARAPTSRRSRRRLRRRCGSTSCCRCASARRWTTPTMVDVPRCAAALRPDQPRPSIETLLHAFVPAAHVDHTHPDAVDRADLDARTAARSPRRRSATRPSGSTTSGRASTCRGGSPSCSRSTPSARAVLLEQARPRHLGRDRRGELPRRRSSSSRAPPTRSTDAGAGRFGLGGRKVAELGDGDGRRAARRSRCPRSAARCSPTPTASCSRSTAARRRSRSHRRRARPR